MIWPIKNPSFANNQPLNISQRWGENVEMYQQSFGIPGHNGLDLVYLNPNSLPGGVSSYGQPILATHDGVIKSLVWAGEHSTKGNGVYLENDSYTSVYWHLSDIGVSVGQQIKAGDKIGKMGNSGWVFPLPNLTNQTTDDDKWGTHLHFAIRPLKDGTIEYPNNGFDGYVDPLPYLLLSKPMRYVLVKDTKEQFLLDDVLRIALNIADETELMALFERGLNKEPEKINSITGYEVYPLLRTLRFKDLLGL